MAYLPDIVVGGINAKPHLQHVANAEPLMLLPEEAPRALQLSPELHKAFLIILNLHIKIDFDQNDHDHFDQLHNRVGSAV